MKTRSQDIRKIDELDLAVETLKDLTPTQTTSAEVWCSPREPDTVYAASCWLRSSSNSSGGMNPKEL